MKKHATQARLGALVLGLLALIPVAAAPVTLAPAESVDSVGMTVANMERSVAFYTEVLTFRKLADVELSGRDYELLTGVFGARARVVTLALGDERLELTEFKAPAGRPFPADTRANDRWFQHVAIIVSDMAEAYARLSARGVQHASTGPQTLPDWNPNAGGIEAYYFRDPDGHFLEVLHFPAGKGDAKWHRTSTLFLGIDHTAIVTSDTDRALSFYRDLVGLRIAGGATNYGVEQEHLNNVFGARLRITTLRAPAGPGIELLDYLAPADGRPAPTDIHASDIAHWQTTIATRGLEALFGGAAGPRLFQLVSPDVIPMAESPLGFTRGVTIRDMDGHALRLVQR